jgi:hypothetical protein
MTDLEQTELDAMTLAGGWKLLCVSTLNHSVHHLVQERSQSVRREYYLSRTGRRRIGQAQKSDLERWMEGGVGVVTFEDCCACLSIQPEIAREKIGKYVSSMIWRS